LIACTRSISALDLAARWIARVIRGESGGEGDGRPSAKKWLSDWKAEQPPMVQTLHADHNTGRSNCVQFSWTRIGSVAYSIVSVLALAV